MRLPIVVVILSYLVLILTDLLIINDLRRMSLYSKYQPETKKTGNWWKVYTVFAILTLVLLTVGIALPKKDTVMGLAPSLWILFIVTTIALAQIFYSVFSILGLIPNIFRKKRINTGLWIGLPVSVLIFSMMWWGVLIGREKINVEKVEIASESLPESFIGYKIVQISDLHVGTWGNDTTFLSKLVKKANSLNPDLIVFTGDIVNRESSELDPFMHTLSQLKAPDGVYSILGNHDYGDYITWHNNSAKRDNLEKLKRSESLMGWKLLDNRYETIKNEQGDSITIIGVGNWGEPPFSQYGHLEKAYPDYDKQDNKFKILLSHNPEHWNREVSKNSEIQLTLAGHTHAMQIMFSLGGWKWSPAEYRYPLWGGLYKRETKEGKDTYLYVNIGAGEVGLPMRIGATPEITLITLGQ